MKTLFEKAGAALKELGAVLVMAAALFLADSVEAQTTNSITLPTTVAAAATNAVSTTNFSYTAAVAVDPRQGGVAKIAVMHSFRAAGAGTSNVVDTIDVSIDGGNTYSTSGPFTLTFSANGTNTVNGYGLLTMTNVTNFKLSTIVWGNTNTMTNYFFETTQLP